MIARFTLLMVLASVAPSTYSLEETVKSLEILWPRGGVREYEVAESATVRDMGVDATVSEFSVSKRYSVKIAGLDARCTSEKISSNGSWESDLECLDNGEYHYLFRRKGEDGESLVRHRRSSGIGYRFASESMIKLVGGTIGAASEPRLVDFLGSYGDRLRSDPGVAGGLGWKCTEQDGTKWDIEFQIVGDLIVPKRIAQMQSYATGPFKRYESVFDEVTIEFIENDRPFIKSCRHRWTSIYRDGKKRETIATLSTTQYRYVPDGDQELTFTTQPRDGLKVSVRDSDWLHHEWRDGKVVQVTDPDAMKRLDEFKFTNEGIAWRKWFLMVASLGLIVGAIWLFRRRASAVIFFAILATGTSGWADEGTSDSGVHQQNDVTVKADSNQSLMGWDEPYCGIVSAFAVLKHFQRSAEFRDLISVDFVGSWEGSSGVQIQNALRKYGVDSTAIGRSTPSTLQACLGPVILHTRSRTSPLYRHWVVYFGQEGDAFRILDPSLGMMTMSAAELQSQWDGLVIAPAQSLPAKPLLLAATLSDYLPAGGLGLCTVAILAFWRGSSARQTTALVSLRRRVFTQATSLAVAGLAVGVFCASFLPGGLNRSESAVATIAGLHPGEFLKSVRLDELPNVSSGQEQAAVLIDCRHESSFRLGTVAGAINIPVDATAALESERLNGIQKHQTLVLFCQSEHCAYDELVARRMIARGFKDVRLYHGGYAEWRSTVENAPESASLSAG